MDWQSRYALLVIGGGASWFAFRKLVLGKWFGRWGFIVLLALMCQAVQAAPPAGLPESVRVSWSGLDITPLSGPDVGGEIPEILPAGAWNLLWNGSVWTLTTENHDNPTLPIIYTWTMDEVGGEYRITLSWSRMGMDEFTMEYLDIEWRSIGGPTGPYPVAYYGALTYLTGYMESHYLATDSGEEAETPEEYGTVSVQMGPEPTGEAFTQGGVPLRIVWTPTDLIWRDGDNEPVAPLSVLAMTEFYTRLTQYQTTGAAEHSGSPLLTQVGYNQASVDWARDFLMAKGNPSAGSSPPIPGAMFTLPVSWETRTFDIPAFGGYAIGALDVIKVDYDEFNLQWKGQSTSSPPIYTFDNRSGTAIGVKPISGAVPERWVILASTEPGTLKPYLEIRKTNGERHRFYFAGHMLSHASVARFSDDGKTRHPLLADVTGQITDTSQVLTRANGIQYWSNTTGSNPLWPSEGAQPVFEMPTSKPADYLGDMITGGGNSDVPGLDVVERVQATSRPSFLGALPETSVPTNAQGAYDLVQDIFEDFGMEGALENDAEGIWQPGPMISGVFGSVAGLENLMDGWGLNFIQWFFGLAMIVSTALYAWRRLWWALGMSAADAEETLPEGLAG